MSDLPALSPIATGTATGAIGSPSVSVDTSRLKTKENLAAAGQKFEAIFTGMMLKSMRSTHLADDLFGSKAQDTFRDMQDARTAQAMAVHAPLGIGKAMTDFLSRAQPVDPEADPAAGAAGPQDDVNQDQAKP